MKFILIADKESEPISFFPLWEVISFVLVMTAILIVLFPHHLRNTIMSYDQPSAVSISYLQSFSKLDPQNSELLMLLAQQSAEFNRITDAEHYFSVLKKRYPAPAPEMAAQFQWTEYLIFKFKTYRSRYETAKHKVLLAQLREKARTLITLPLTVKQLKMLATDNLDYNQRAVSLTIYQNLMDKNELTTPQDLEQGGVIAMKNRAYRPAANFYMAAYHKAITLDDKRKYATEVMQALWAGNFVEEAFNYATHLPDLVLDDPAMLLYVAQLAIAAKHQDIAKQYVLKVLFWHQHKRK